MEEMRKTGVAEKKVGVLTWYKAINHGAVLQAYASCEMLKEFGAAPILLDYNRSMYKNKNKKERFFKRIKRFTPSKFIWHMKVKRFFENKSLNFHTFTKEYLNIGSLYNIESDLKAVYIGSDMVFDIWEGYNPYMYGKGIDAPYIFSYAASFGYTTTKRIQESGHADEIASCLSRFKEIGYRDQNTYGICKELGLTVPLRETIDPVLCYGFETERDKWDTGYWCTKKYILIYAYDSTMNDKETVDVIRQYAKKAGLLIVSCGYFHDWCDICVPASPIEFLEMFKHAQYVVTDTFHGTVFSLILHKQFVSIIRNNGFKVEYLLKSSSMESRIARTPVETMTVAASDVRYDIFDCWLHHERNQSREFIKENVKKAFEVKI